MIQSRDDEMNSKMNEYEILKKQLDMCQIEISSSKNELDECFKCMTDMTNEISSKQEEMNSLQSRLKELDDLQVLYKRTKDGLEETTHSLSLMKTENNSLAGALSKIQKLLGTKPDEVVKNLQKKLKIADEENNDLKLKLDTNNHEIKNLNTQIILLNDKIHQQENKSLSSSNRIQTDNTNLDVNGTEVKMNFQELASTITSPKQIQYSSPPPASITDHPILLPINHSDKNISQASSKAERNSKLLSNMGDLKNTLAKIKSLH